MSKRALCNIALIATAAAAMIMLSIYVCGNLSRMDKWTVAQVAEAIKQNRVVEITINVDSERTEAILTDGREVDFDRATDTSLEEQLMMEGVTAKQLAQLEWHSEDHSFLVGIITVVLMALPFIVFAVVFAAIYLFTRIRSRREEVRDV